MSVQAHQPAKQTIMLSGLTALVREASLGPRASLFVSAGVVAHTLWTSAAPALAYRIYADEWHLNHTVTTGIFAIYPVVVVLTLIGVGDISDHIGRRATMLMGLGASLAGTVLFAVAPDVLWLFAARALMGIGVGLTAGPSTAAVVAFATGDPSGNSSRRAALIATVAQAAGFAAAFLVGGALIAYAPWPTRLSFWVLAMLVAALLAATWFLPRHSSTDMSVVWRPRLPFVPSNVRKTFATASVAMMTAYTHGVLILSLGGQVAHDLIGSPNALVNGAVLSLFAIVSGAVSIVARSLVVRTAMTLGAFASAAGMGLLAMAVALHSLPIFLLFCHGHGWGRIQPALPQRVAGYQHGRAGTAPRCRALRPLSAGLSVDGYGRHQPGHRGDRLGATSGHRFGRGRHRAPQPRHTRARDRDATVYGPPFPLAPACACSNP
jgi:MFS family permease